MDIINETFDENPPLILIVDDIQKNLQLLANTLYDAGYEIAMAESGREALEFLKDSLPDLILLDVMMPELTGFEVCKIIKEDEKTKNIPIIFLTAKVETDSIVEGFELGAVDYITKPFNSSELLSRVKTHVELKRSRDKILEINEQLVRLNKKKSEFLGIAVHDLKNPLQGILSFSELLIQKLSENKESDQYIKFLDYIKLSGNHMYKIVTDILNVETLESGKLKLNIQKRNITSILKNVVSANLISAQNKKLSIYISCPNFLYSFVDADRIQEAFDNYISNAIKYSPLGKNIWISLYITKFDNDLCFVLKVRDEGPGLTEKDKEKVFGRFQKLTAKPTANEPSSGLGLSIVKTIVEYHSGKVWVESEHKDGAKFYLQIKADDDNTEAIANYFDCEKFFNFEKAEEYIEINDCERTIEDFNPNNLDESVKQSIIKIKNVLVNEIEPRYNEILHKNILSEIRQFSRELEKIGIDNKIEALIKFSTILNKYCAFFELDKVEKALLAFPSLLNKLYEIK